MPRARVMKIDSPSALGGRLASARAARGLSLRKLAFPGCTAAYISAIENGRRVPSLQVLQVLADRLGVSVAHLARGARAAPDAQLDDIELSVRLGDPLAARSGLEFVIPELEGRRLARALALRGLLRLQDGALELGVADLEQAQEVSAAEFLAVPTAVEALGKAYATRGEYESALALFGEARVAALRSGDRPRALKSTVLQANVFIDLGDLGHSAEALAEALRDATELRDPMLRAGVLWSQARLHTLEGRQDLAASLAERALETLRSNEDERAVGLAHQMLAYIELERGDPGHALELLDQGAEMVARGGDATEAAAFELDRARALLALERLEEAHAVLEDVAPILIEETGGNGGRCLVTLAELSDRLGRPEDALVRYDLAIERLGDHRNPHLVRALRMKSELLSRLGRDAEAYAVLRAAVEAQDSTSGRF
jgi:tetratricopeptide (TPR) repeat protein